LKDTVIEATTGTSVPPWAAYLTHLPWPVNAVVGSSAGARRTQPCFWHILAAPLLPGPPL
jgi:hypothetical protein